MEKVKKLLEKKLNKKEKTIYDIINKINEIIKWINKYEEQQENARKILKKR